MNNFNGNDIDKLKDLILTPGEFMKIEKVGPIMRLHCLKADSVQVTWSVEVLTYDEPLYIKMMQRVMNGELEHIEDFK